MIAGAKWLFMALEPENVRNSAGFWRQLAPFLPLMIVRSRVRGPRPCYWM